MKDLLRSWLPAWPASCAICAGWPARPICPACLERHGRPLPRCPGCALALAPGLERCTRCAEAGPGPLQQCLARVDYAHPWSVLVARLKRDPAWAPLLARLLVDAPGLPALLQATDLMLPIPLSPDKLRARGYDQAWELTKALRRQLRDAPPALPGLLQRRPQAATQHELARAQRFDNALQAYAVDPAAGPQLRGRRILLVDDVMTTGATLQSAATLLLAAGAAQVSALVFARTPAPTLD
ncbi:ComF family protein [Malikia spinosa]|uniref:ComF family protein n=1 Tax=Malikia spinosa TaxID=86180 RepID=UPI003FA29F8D